MKILYLSDGKTACSYLREKLPKQFLEKDFGHEVRIDAYFEYKLSEKGDIVSIKSENLIWCDVIVFVRSYKQNALALAFLKAARGLGKHIIYETDDWLFGLADGQFKESISSTAYRNNPEKRYQMEQICKQSEIITTTTEYLANNLRNYNKKVIVLPNSINFKLYKRKEFKNKKLRVLVSGGGSHFCDYQLLMEPIREAKKQIDFDVVFLGFDPKMIKKIFDLSKTNIPWVKEMAKTIQMASEISNEYHDFVPEEKYPRLLCNLKIDLGLIPLEDTEFNRNKSNIKFVEYTSAGIPVIASKVEPYETTIEHEKTGILVKNKFLKWKNAIIKMLTQHDYRGSIWKNAFDYVKINNDIEKNVKLWDTLYTSL